MAAPIWLYIKNTGLYNSLTSISFMRSVASIILKPFRPKNQYSKPINIGIRIEHKLLFFKLSFTLQNIRGNKNGKKYNVMRMNLQKNPPFEIRLTFPNIRKVSIQKKAVSFPQYNNAPKKDIYVIVTLAETVSFNAFNHPLIS